MARESVAVRGRVVLAVTDDQGRPQQTSHGENQVVEGGRLLLVRLLSGEVTQPAFYAVAGVSDRPTESDIAKLYEMDGLEMQASDCRVVDGEVKVRAEFPKARKTRVIKEAGLMLRCRAGTEEETRLYNRALVLPPLTVREEEVLTMTWTLTFGRTEV